MVEIRRPTRHRSSSSSFWTCRNLVLMAVLFQMLSLIVSLLRTTPKPKTTTDNNNNKRKLDTSHSPKGLHDALEAWRGTGGGSQQQKQKGQRVGATKVKKLQTIRKQQEPLHRQKPPNDQTKKDYKQQQQPKDEDHSDEDSNEEIIKPPEDQDEPADEDTEKQQENEEGNEEEAEVGPGNEEGGGEEPDEEEKTLDAGDGEPVGAAVIDAKGAVVGKQGSGPTAVGYLADYQYERDHPAFRNGKFPDNTAETERKVASQIYEQGAIKSCQYVQDGKLLIKSNCRDTETALIVYNSAPFPRTWCGVKIEPNTVKSMEEHCSEPVRLFPTNSMPLNGAGMPPIIITSRRGADDLETVSCDIPCQAEKRMQGTQRYIEGTDWKITQSWDDPFSNAEARVERTAYRNDEYFSTTSFKSSVPLSFYSFDKYDLRHTQAVDYDATENTASYLIDSDCHSSGSRRQKWFASLKAQYSVAALGGCHHDTQLPSGESLSTPEGRIHLMKRYRFNMAFDFMTEKDHIPPMMWESLLSGSVPILLGAQNMKDHLPAKSFIFAGDFSLWDLMSKFVVNVAANKTLWESYHAWRSDQKILDEFEVKYNFTRTEPTCRMCRWAYARKYGLGWNHQQQVIQENHLTRKLCADSHSGLAFSPFQESWLTATDRRNTKVLRPAALSTCPELTDVEHTIDVSDEVKVHRSLVQHDGVTDISVHKIEVGDQENVFLQLEFDVRNSEGAYFPNTHRLVTTQRGALVTSITIQDEHSKVTVLANWDTKITSPVEGVIEILIQEDGEGPSQDQERRIRVITEDMNSLHDKMTEFFPSPFGKMMTKDFVDPLETFYLESENR